MIESGMIGLREGDDEFAGSLVTCIDIHTAFLQPSGVHKGDKLKEEIRLCLKKIWCFTPDSSLKFVCIISRNAIPRFGLSPMHYGDVVINCNVTVQMCRYTHCSSNCTYNDPMK